MRKSLFTAGVPLMCGVMFLTGCVNISYDGVSETPLPSDSKIGLYFSQDQLPKVSFKKLGVAVANANSTYTASEVESKLKEFARDKGANGVLIVKIRRTPVGMARPDQISNQRSYSWIPDDTTHNSYLYFREDMMTYSDKANPEKMTYDISITADLLKLNLPVKKMKK